MMTQYRIYLFLILLCGSGSLSAQTMTRDSLLTGKIHRLSKDYGLSPSQETDFLALARQHHQSMDSVNKLHLDPEQRKQWLTAHFAEHDRKLKSIMNADQWQRYTKMLRERQDAFLKRTGDKKMPASTITRGN